MSGSSKVANGIASRSASSTKTVSQAATPEPWGSDECAMPEAADGNGSDAQRLGELEPIQGLGKIKDLFARGHPKDIRQFRFPRRRRHWVFHGAPEALALLSERLSTQQEIRDDVRVYDRVHGRPARSQSSISPAVGLRLCEAQARSIWAIAEARSPT